MARSCCSVDEDSKTAGVGEFFDHRYVAVRSTKGGVWEGGGGVGF